jgi:hypothetical protein
MKTRLVMVGFCLLVGVFLMAGPALAQVEQAPGIDCDNAEAISPSYAWRNNTLGPDGSIHFYKIYVQKGELLAVDLINNNPNTGNMWLALYRDGWYAGAPYNCVHIMNTDNSPAPRLRKRLVFIPEIAGYYFISIHAIAGSVGGPYRLRALTAPITPLAN